MEKLVENDVLKRDALFIVPNFVDRSFAAELCREADSAKQYRTPLVDVEKRIESEKISECRPNVVFDFSQSLQTGLVKKLSDIKPAIERFFSFGLGEYVESHVTIWKSGDFIGRHVDAVEPQNRSQEPIIRIVVLIFLNDHVGEGLEPEPGSQYAGGNLTIYGLIKDKAFEDFGYPVEGKTGTLVAYRSTAIHEVTPIQKGIRYVLKSGYY